MKIDGLKVQKEIACRRMTMRDFAKKAGLPTATVYRAINGKRATIRTVGKIATALQISPADIFLTPARL